MNHPRHWAAYSAFLLVGCSGSAELDRLRLENARLARETTAAEAKAAEMETAVASRRQKSTPDATQLGQMEAMAKEIEKISETAAATESEAVKVRTSLERVRRQAVESQ